MENKIAEFVLGTKKTAISLARPTLAAIPGLAEAAIQVNGMFILAKLHIKCSLISVHHGGRYTAGAPCDVSRSVVL